MYKFLIKPLPRNFKYLAFFKKYATENTMGENMRKTATKTHKKKEIFKRKLKFVSESNENQNQFIIINFGPNLLKLIIVFNNGILFFKKK